MTYLWPSGSPIIQLQCNGTTKRLRRCRVRALGFESERDTYYCGRHIHQRSTRISSRDTAERRVR